MSSIENTIINAISGGLAGTVTDMIFYSLDSFKIQRQSGEKISMHRLYRGVLPIALMGSFPSLAVFFGVFTPLKEYATSQGQEVNRTGVFAASIIAAIPSSIVAIPSDVLKKRVVLGIDSNIRSAFYNILKSGGMRGFFLGWQSNMMKDIPFAGLKISLYENIKAQYLLYQDVDHVTAVESAMVGLVAGTITSVLTCPIDCVNTRIKSGELATYSVVRAHGEIVRRDGLRALFRGLVPRTVILSLGSSVFWFWFAKLQDGLNNATNN